MMKLQGSSTGWTNLNLLCFSESIEIDSAQELTLQC